MKNTIPLVMAVLLGLAAVFAVNRKLTAADKTELTEEIVVANRELSANSKLEAGVCGRVSIPRTAYLEGRHIRASQIARIEGLSVLHRIAAGSHILWDDLDTGTDDRRVGKGEFVVAVKFQGSDLIEHIRPGDEIAIAALQTVETMQRSGDDLNAAPVIHRDRRLSILFPCVKALEVSRDSILVSAPPERALQLLVASQNLPLYPLLRSRDDRENLGVGVGGSVSVGDLTVENLSATAP